MFRLKSKNLFLSIILSLCVLLCLCGCSSNKNYHEHSHKFNVEKVVNPTCSEEGFTQYYCPGCGYKYRGDYLPPLQSGGHNYNDYVCVDCGDFLIDEAVDTATLTYSKTIDQNNGNNVYAVTGVTADSAYIKIPSTYNGLPVTQIADKAFRNLLSLQHVILPDSIVSIGNDAFAFCFNLKSINIPDSVTSIGEEAFGNCHHLESISLGSIKKVNKASFIACYRIEEIVIPDGVTTIYTYAFDSCFNLTSVTIPQSVSMIYHAAFWNAYNLKDIYYEGTLEQWLAINKEKGIFDNNEDASWDAYTEDYTVHCIDGDITKNSN